MHSAAKKSFYCWCLSGICLLLSGLHTVESGDLMLQATGPNQLNVGPEERLITALEDIGRNRIDDAIANLEALVKTNPRFRLAQLIYADLLYSRSRAITDFGNLPSASYTEISALREEAAARLRYHRSVLDIAGKIPRSLVQLERAQGNAIIVDLSLPRLFVFEMDQDIPRLVADFYVSIGKNGIGKFTEGDKKTPVGVYFALDFIDPKDLPDLYGNGAFPINYPNVWDRRNGHSGDGIWLHGTPSSTYSRPPRDSDGCVIVSNEDLARLAPYIKTGSTPVILAQQVEWLSPHEWQAQQETFHGFVEQWRKDWESRNTEKYLSHYSREYLGLGMDYEEWARYKRRVNTDKQFIRIKLNDTSIFLYPDAAEIMVVTFEQDYSSDTVKRRYRKRQYWQLEKDGKWRIFYEGSVS
ncbi:MAG TPA: L,D-transpeptidase family protein [Gammaproteobacteria bacterium]|nr:L,D-transpeptidase family protein [Gammaproteobacteria bacterium]